MRSSWLKAGLVLAAIWICAGAVIFFARHIKVTPESLLQYVEKHPLNGLSAADRARTIEKVAEQLNQLTYDERRQVRFGRKLDGFFKSLNLYEQSRFLDLTVRTGFKQMMESLNKMTPEKRKQVIERAMRDMKPRDGEGSAGEEANDRYAQKMMDQGFKSFYSDASAETKMDAAPLIEQLQKNLQGR